MNNLIVPMMLAGAFSLISPHAMAQQQEIKQQETQNEAAQVSGLKGKELTEFKANMDSLQVTDKEMWSTGDVSSEKARSMTTEELIMQTCRQKLWLILSLYPGSPKVALYRVSRCSNSLTELLSRKDFAPAFLKAYSSFDANPKTNPYYEAMGGPFGLGWILALQGYSALKNQMAGHEKEILLVLCKKYREVKKVNASYPKGQHVYSTTFVGLGTAQNYAKDLFPKARILSIRLETDKSMEPAVKELEKLCGYKVASFL
ncbi:MAG: hypothetical protein V4671_06910 [Armatimonadota bacterium]